MRLSDGLHELSKGEADTVICAGMGGRLVVKILSEGKEVLDEVEELILQPQSEIHLVRRYLYENGYVIAQENMVLDEGKYYQLMRAVKVKDRREEKNAVPGNAGVKITDAEAKYGPCLLRQRHPVLKEFLILEKKKYEGIRIELEKTNPDKAGELRKKCLLIEEALAGYVDEV